MRFSMPKNEKASKPQKTRNSEMYRKFDVSQDFTFSTEEANLLKKMLQL